MKCIPAGSETGAVLVGKADFVDHPVTAFVRLSHGRDMAIKVCSALQPAILAKYWPSSYIIYVDI